jgi:hypothetical protein
MARYTVVLSVSNMPNMLGVIRLIVIMLSVIMLSVVAPFHPNVSKEQCYKTFYRCNLALG